MGRFWHGLRDWRSHLKTLGWLMLIAFAANLWQSRHVPQGHVPAPDAPMLAAQGEPASNLNDWLKRHRGEVVAVHFWATWCPICRASEDNITRLQPDWPIVTVAMQSGEAGAVQRHLLKADLQWPTALDPDGALAKAWGVSAVPATIILDRDGRIASASTGYTSTLGLWARLWWVRISGA